MLEVSLSGVGTVLRLERDACSMVKRLEASNKSVPPPPLLFNVRTVRTLMGRLRMVLTFPDVVVLGDYEATYGVCIPGIRFSCIAG